MPVSGRLGLAARTSTRVRRDAERPSGPEELDAWVAAPTTRDAVAAGGFDSNETLGAAGGLVVGQVADPEEARADRVADSVMHTLRRTVAEPGGAVGGERVSAQPSAALHRSAAPHAAVVGVEGGPLEAGVSDEIVSNLGGGSPIPAPLRRTMEGAFGRDLGEVRLHTDAPAARLSRQITARAFTVGRDVFFGAGEYRPDTVDGQRTLAHELAHTGEGRPAGGPIRREPTSAEQQRKQQKAAQEQQKKALENQAKQEKKDKRDKAKKEKAERKETIGASKTALSAEKKRLAAERKTGTKQRADLSARIIAAPTTMDHISPVDSGESTEEDLSPTRLESGEDGVKTASLTAASTGPLRGRTMENKFQENLAAEQSYFRDAVNQGMDVVRAAEWVYQLCWLQNPDPDLRAVRPPRETEAERLVSEIRAARTAAGVRGQMDEVAQRGNLLSPEIEKAYERYEQTLTTHKAKGVSDAHALQAAEYNAWTKLDPTLLADRPEPGSALDIKAHEQARRRIAVMSDEEKSENGLDAVGELGEKAETHFGRLEKVLDTVSYATKLGGAKQTAAMRESAGEEAGYNESDMVYQGLATPEGGETKIPIVGEQIEAFEQMNLQIKTGVKTVPPGAVPTSTSSMVSAGFESVTGMLGGLLSGFNGAIAFARAVQKAHSTQHPEDIARATAIGAQALGSFTASAKSAAGLAQTINPDVTVSVAHVVPGLDIFAASMSIVSGTMGMVETAMRVQSTQAALNSAHAAHGKTDSHVLVHPLLRVEQSYVKGLEREVWRTTAAVVNLGASIAQIATAGGYGAPAAVKASVSVLNMLHSLGHIIADDVLTLLAKQAQEDSVAVLEGSAESVLQRDPAMAVDGIIVKAAKGDPVAQSFLSNFSVNDKPIDAAMLAPLLAGGPASVGKERLLVDVRRVVLKSMGSDENPTYTYEKYKESAAEFIGSVSKHTTGKFALAGKVAEERNRVGHGGTTSRGVGWRLKMMFTSEKKLQRAHRQLTVTSETTLPPGALCECGGIALMAPANGDAPSAAEMEQYVKVISHLTDKDFVFARNNPANPPEWREFFADILRDRALSPSKAGNAAA